MTNYELIIIGGGAAGFSAALKADELGVKTLMINDNALGLGGTCVNVGCVPTKHLLHVTKLIHHARNNSFKGLKFSIEHDFKKIIEEKNEIVESLRREKYENLIDEMENVDLIEGRARFISETTVKVNGKIYESKKFIVSTGSSTFIPPFEGIREVNFLTHVDALSLKEQPESMIVLGGGAVAAELSQIFNRLGTEVTVLQRSARILKKFEPELARQLQGYLKDDGVRIVVNTSIKKIFNEGKDVVVKAEVNGKEKVFKARSLLVATGRRGNTDNLGLENTSAKINPSNKTIIVDDTLQATPTIWAAGDVIGELMLETVAAREGMIAATNALSEQKIKMDYNIVPRAIFTDPELATVGLTPDQASEQGIKVWSNYLSLDVVPRARAIKETDGGIKIVANADTNEIIGIHVLSPNASEIIHEATMILKNKMTIEEVIETIHVFPTISEIIKIASQSRVRDVSKMSCCVE